MPVRKLEAESRMPQEIVPNLFQVVVPLLGSPLKSVNSYVLKGPDRSLVIDTGMNRPECLEALEGGFRDIGLDLNKTDFFITHFHADHLGLVGEVAAKGARIYFNEPEARFIASVAGPGRFWERVAVMARKGGFPEEEIEESLRKHPGVKYSAPVCPDFTIVHEKDVIGVGDFALECILTPGHTMGHMCLYDRAKRLFISGDHILGDITPNISSWSEDLNPLQDYLQSLDKVAPLDVEWVLPGHRNIFHDFRGRIEELKRHHADRAEEALHVLSAGPLTVYEVASRMTWDIVADSWDDFPVMQKWFATGEAGTHLKYLITLGQVRAELRDDIFVFERI